MTQEEKQLLLVDLSARLFYAVICQVDDGAAGLNDGKLIEIDISKELVRFDADFYWDAYIDDVKPYLRPMSSMTEAEKRLLGCELSVSIKEEDCGRHTEEYGYTLVYHEGEWLVPFEAIDWLNKHHFDYRGLIDKGLALEAPEDMYK